MVIINDLVSGKKYTLPKEFRTYGDVMIDFNYRYGCPNRILTIKNGKKRITPKRMTKCSYNKYRDLLYRDIEENELNIMFYNLKGGEPFTIALGLIGCCLCTAFTISCIGLCIVVGSFLLAAAIHDSGDDDPSSITMYDEYERRKQEKESRDNHQKSYQSNFRLLTNFRTASERDRYDRGMYAHLQNE